MSGRSLIVNADDLGRSRGINDGIFAAHEHGIVTSTTLMVGFAAAEDAARRIREHPRLGVGLHLVFTGGRPLLAPEQVPSLVDRDGLLARRPDALADPHPDDVRREATAQIERFRALTGRMPTHLDSHHHSHRHPRILNGVLELAREHRLPVRAASPEVRRELLAHGIATTAEFIGTFYGERATLDALLEILSGLGGSEREEGPVELMCHPGNADPELRRTSTYAAERERELAILTAPEVIDAVDAAGLELTSFAALSTVLSPSP